MLYKQSGSAVVFLWGVPQGKGCAMSQKEIYDERYKALVACLKVARKKLGMSQAAVAGRLGTNRSWVAKVETCELRLDLLHFVKLCAVYGVKAQELIRMMG